MAMFESLTNALRLLVVGDRVRVTLRPETGRFPNPMEGKIMQKDEAGTLWIESPQGAVEIASRDILSITKMSR